MMNIFIMVLVFMFMAGYYFMDAPSQRVAEQEIEYAINRSDLRSVAECAAGTHTAAIKGVKFEDVCIQQYSIATDYVCLNDRQSLITCDIVRNKKPAASFVLTSTGVISDSDYNGMLEILEKYYPNSGTFGIFIEDAVLTGGNSGKRVVPKSIIASAKLTDGQIVYMTQYEIPDPETEYNTQSGPDIQCPAGTVKTYRFAKWQCIGFNLKTNCTGDRIWDSDLMECVPDDSRRPLCGAKQTAVIVDDVWECLDPFLEKKCPAGMIPRLNYSNLEWECIVDPSSVPDTKKCMNIHAGAIYGGIGSTLRVPPTSCTDCEEMITDPETCKTTCIPNPSKLTDPKCYPGKTDNCRGNARAFYFGFPTRTYATYVTAIANRDIPLDKMHSQNRKFNCLDCGERGIDTERSFPPYIAICNK